MSRRETIPSPSGPTSATALTLARSAFLLRLLPVTPRRMLSLACAFVTTISVLTAATAAAAAVPPARTSTLTLTTTITTKKALTRGQIAASAALAQLGVSFSWGGGSSRGPTFGIGRGAATRGFDCSGLTLYAWSRAGVPLSHYTGAQFRQGRRVAHHARRTGDLLFFGGGRGDPTHVALYLGGGVMIHAPKTGDVVRRTRFLRSAYFRAAYRGTVRPG
ncbi:NlpC/P60 family protein [Nonomuraea sp. NPDC050783]|uniref:NlpC/P60 family protein n=1 Tax=Nonomuraea sp. NPDC050783 TaxID=3154634 RepID=UPI003466FDA6